MTPTGMPAAAVRASVLGLAHALGNVQRMSLFGEGNVSAKIDPQRMWIKASGTSLASLKEDELVAVHSEPILTAVESDRTWSDEKVNALLMDARVDPDALKPSVETLFHAWLLTQPDVGFVGHVHAMCVNALLCTSHAEAFAYRRVIPDQVVYTGPTSILIPYVDPGLTLARRIAREVTAYRLETGHMPRTILLQNHGIIAVGATDQQVEAAIMMAEKCAGIHAQAAALGPVSFMESEQVERIAGRSDERYRQSMLQRRSSV